MNGLTRFVATNVAQNGSSPTPGGDGCSRVTSVSGTFGETIQVSYAEGEVHDYYLTEHSPYSWVDGDYVSLIFAGDDDLSDIANNFSFAIGLVDTYDSCTFTADVDVYVRGGKIMVDLGQIHDAHLSYENYCEIAFEIIVKYNNVEIGVFNYYLTFLP